MPAPLTFALYRKAHPALAEPVGTALDIELRFPVINEGVPLFRTSLWLPLPEACRTASALSLDGSTLQASFRPAEFTLDTDDVRWFSVAEDSDNQRTRLEMVWPAPIVRIDTPVAGSTLTFGLHRADGEAISAEPAQRGTTGIALDPPWIGSPLVVKFDSIILPGAVLMGTAQNTRSRTLHVGSRATGAQGSTAIVHEMTDAQLAMAQQIAALQRHSALVPRVRIAARPTSPRLRLVLEGDEHNGGDRLLWQAMLPGEHAGPVALPDGGIADEWAAALEQVLAVCQRDPLPEVLPRLRLDIESDAPCMVGLSNVALILQADHTLLAEPLRLDFDGMQHASHALELAPTHGGGSPLQLSLKGRLRAAETPAAGKLPTSGGPDGRAGLLVEEDQRVSGERHLDAPATLAGLSFDWHALSERLAGVVRVLPANARRGTPALVEQAFDFDTAHPAGTASQPQRLAVRWPALDLQAQALRIELSVTEGRGLWLAEPGGHGWRAHRVPEDGEGRALGLDLHVNWLEAAPASAPGAGNSPGHEPVFSLGAQTLAFSKRDKGRFELSIAAPALASWPTLPIKVASGVASEVVVESATLRTTAI